MPKIDEWRFLTEKEQEWVDKDIDIDYVDNNYVYCEWIDAYYPADEWEKADTKGQWFFGEYEEL